MRRSATVKLLGGGTGGSIMLFEETLPAGTETIFDLCWRTGTATDWIRKGSVRRLESSTVPKIRIVPGGIPSSRSAVKRWWAGRPVTR